MSWCGIGMKTGASGWLQRQQEDLAVLQDSRSQKWAEWNPTEFIHPSRSLSFAARGQRGPSWDNYKIYIMFSFFFHSYSFFFCVLFLPQTMQLKCWGRNRGVGGGGEAAADWQETTPTSCWRHCHTKRGAAARAEEGAWQEQLLPESWCWINLHCIGADKTLDDGKSWRQETVEYIYVEYI